MYSEYVIYTKKKMKTKKKNDRPVLMQAENVRRKINVVSRNKEKIISHKTGEKLK